MEYRVKYFDYQISFFINILQICKILIYVVCLIERDIKQLTEDKRFGYVTYQDIRSIESFRQKTVLVVKAPPETELQVPQDHNDGEVSIKIYKYIINL